MNKRFILIFIDGLKLILYIYKMTTVFVVSTNGHCFYCLIKLEETETESGGSSVPVHYPVRDLCRYLKVDLRKLASETEHNGHFPAVPTGTEARLEVGLCEDCASTNQDFTDLYPRLKEEEEEEKAAEIELEIAYCFKLIQRKLTTANSKGIITDDQDELRFAMALRTELTRKCSQKLNSLLSNVEDEDEPATGAHVVVVDPPKKTPAVEDDMPNDIIKTEPDDNDNDNPTEEPDDANDEQAEGEDGLEPGAELLTGVHEEATKYLRKITNPSANSLSLDDADADIDSNKPEFDPDSLLYKCQLCPKEFRDRTASQRHFQAVHLGLLFQCTLCSKSFRFRATFTSHFRTVHRGVRFKCRGCSEKFSCVQNVREHYQAVHCGNRFKCQFCPASFASTAGRTVHVRDRCPAKFGLNTRKRGKSKPKPVTIKIANDGVVKIEGGPSKQAIPKKPEAEKQGNRLRKPTKANLAAAAEAAKKFPFIEVVTDADPTDEAPQPLPNYAINPITKKCKCNSCGKEFSSKKGLRGHYQALHLKLRYKCKLCGREFVNRQGCKTHHSEVHVETEVEVTEWECLACGRLFQQHSSVRTHQAKTGCCEGVLEVKTNKVKKSYACEACGWMFSQPHDLERHAQTVHSQKRVSKFKCDICGAEFGIRSNRTKHMSRVHKIFRHSFS